MKSLFVFLFILFTHEVGFCLPDRTSDTKKKFKPKQFINVRLHNMGQFMFSGRIISSNPALDFYYQYDRKTWGAVFFKAFDLYEPTSPNNFGLAMVRKNFHVGEKLTITPQAGFIFEQAYSFADKGTDLASFIITNYKVSNIFSIEYTAVFFNLALYTKDRDWVNRLRFLYSKKHWDVTLSAWHNNNLIDHDNSKYISTGFNVFYSRMKVSKHVLMSAGVNGLMINSTNVPNEYPKKNGIFFTVIATLH